MMLMVNSDQLSNEVYCVSIDAIFNNQNVIVIL